MGTRTGRAAAAWRALGDRLAQRRLEAAGAPVAGADPGPQLAAVGAAVLGRARSMIDLGSRGLSGGAADRHRPADESGPGHRRGRARLRSTRRLLGLPPRCLASLGGQRLGDVLELLLLGLDAEEQLGDAADRHHHGADEEADRDLVLAAGVDQVAEEQRPGDAAGRGADRVEEGDRERPRLHREDLADGQVGGAGAGRGDEEDRQHEGHERPGREAVAEQEDAERRGQRRRAEVGGGDHRLAPDRVEEAAEGERPEEVGDARRGRCRAGSCPRRRRRIRPAGCRGRR